MEEELFGNTFVTDLNAVRKELDLPPVGSWLAWMSVAKRRIGFWPKWFADTLNSQIPAIPIGFPLDSTAEPEQIPARLQKILDSDEPLVLVTGGTSKLQLINPDFYTASIETCKLLGCSAIVAAQYRDQLPDRLPDRIEWFEYLPFARIMPRMAAIIHHGGMGTLSQAIAAGVPQVILPNFSDGRDNAARLKQLGVAEALPPRQWTPYWIAEALNRAMTPHVQKRCQDLAQQLRNDHFAGSVVPPIEEVIANECFLIATADLHLIHQAGDRAEPVYQAAQDVQKINVLEHTKNISADKRALLLQLIRQKRSNDCS
jgi:UDP:flavonoid glycosyltransferase YjiC (YdhE family)